MPEFPPEQVTPFVFSDPSGKRWPRLRLILLIGGVLFFVALVLFVQTLFVIPKMNVPFSLRQLKGQLRALERANPAGQLSPASLLWQKFSATRQAAKKLAGTAPTTSPRPRKKPPVNEVRLAFYANGDPDSYASLQQHAAQITHVCPEWMTVIDGMGNLQIDSDSRVSKLAANKGIALMPLLTNLVGDTWQPEAIENLAHGPAERQERLIQEVLAVLRNAKAAGVVVDWQQIDPAYKKDLTTFIDKFADALHDDNKELWLCVQPGQELDYIDIDALGDNIDRFVAMLFDETSDTDRPGPLASRSWFEGWLNVPRRFKFDNRTRRAMELIKSTETVTDVGDGEIVTVDEDRTDGTRKVTVDADGYLTAKYGKFAEFPTLYHQGAGSQHQVAIT